MHQRIADRELTRAVGIPKEETIEVLNDLVVPGQLAFLDEKAQRRGGEHLRVRSDGKQGIRVHAIVLALLEDPETLREDHLFSIDNRHGDAGHRPLYARRLHPVCPALEVRLRAGHRRGEQAPRRHREHEND